jgi:hypothetical protein
MHVLVGGVCWRSAFLTALEATTAPASASPSTVAEARELFDNLATQAEEPLDYHQYAAGCQPITRAVVIAQGEGDNRHIHATHAACAGRLRERNERRLQREQRLIDEDAATVAGWTEEQLEQVC